MTNHYAELDRVFHALSDSTRRAVLAQLSDEPAPVKELAEPFEMALPSFMQHLKVLEECGLVTSQKEGRVRTYQLTPYPLEEAEGWLKEKRNLWAKRLDRLDEYLMTMKETKK